VDNPGLAKKIERLLDRWLGIAVGKMGVDDLIANIPGNTAETVSRQDESMRGVYLKKSCRNVFTSSW